MQTKQYNGWTNYETWNVALWIGNEEGSSSYWDEQAQEAYDESEADDTFTRMEQATLDLSKRLESEFDSASCDLLEQAQATSSVWADLLGAALSEVNWHEIAEHILENVEKETETA